MDSKKVGSFIKEIRKNNNLTQKELADKYGVTYQAVSKWENGLNLPDITLLRQMSKDFNISMEDILDGETTTKKTSKKYLLIIPLIIIIFIIGYIIHQSHAQEPFDFKTISTTCEEFKVTGSLAYNQNKSSIYISEINYCGGDDNTIYKEIECTLYEKNNDTNTKISSCKSNTDNIKLEDYLKDVELNIDNYTKSCKKYTNDSLYLEVNATDKNNKTITYKIPLNLNNNCPKELN